MQFEGFDIRECDAVIFDLDDTLVKTNLDFAKIKREIACPAEQDLLTHVEQMSCAQQQAWAHKVILDHEMEDAHTSTWLDGAQAFVQSLREADLPLAIVTRNCRAATDIKLRNNKIPINLVLTREDAPAKPDPTALLMIASQWALLPQNIAYIGDYKYDIEAAHNAKMQAWLYQYQAGTAYQQLLSHIPAT